MNTENPFRRMLRLPGYDYTLPGAYFVTLVTLGRNNLFGEVNREEVQLTIVGEITRACWKAVPCHFSRAGLDEFVIMPNHLHGILWIFDDENRDKPCVGARHAVPLQQTAMDLTNGGRALSLERFGKPRSGSIPTILRSFKSAVTRQINEMLGTPGAPVWQRGYYEHVVRDEADLARIRAYITDNPAQWALDRENPLSRR